MSGTKNRHSEDEYTEDVDLAKSDFDKYLERMEGPRLHPSLLEPMDGNTVPRVTMEDKRECFAEEFAVREAQRAQALAELEGPHFSAWDRQRELIAEVARLTELVRTSSGSERSANRSELRVTEEELSAFQRTPEFQTALRYQIEKLRPAMDRIEAAKPTNPRAVRYQHQALDLWNGLRALLVEPTAEEARPDAQKCGNAKRETQGDLVEKWLAECEKKAKELGVAFDRWKMPGQKPQFLNLLHSLDASLQSIKTVDSLDRYLKGRCVWPLGAGKAPDASPLYARLFPEAAKKLGQP